MADPFNRVHSFAQILENMKHNAPELEYVGRTRMVEFDIKNGGEDGGPFILPEKIMGSPDNIQDMMGKLADHGGREILTELYFAGALISDGPKVFRPSLAQCLSLEDISANLHIRDYRQPFEVMVIEFPKEYTAMRSVLVPHEVHGDTEVHPVCVAIGNPIPEFVCMLLYTDLGAGLRFNVSHNFDTIEQSFVRIEEHWQSETNLKTEERFLTSLTGRIAVNAMLLMNEFGMHRIGVDNEKNRRRLESYVDKAKKRGDKDDVETATRNLRMLPVQFAMDQDISLAISQAPPPSEPDPNNPERRVRPHWRRGHWREQPCGPGKKEKKRIFVRPAMIHAEELVAGPTTTSTYTTQEPNGHST